jgi:hypothetical protein
MTERTSHLDSEADDYLRRLIAHRCPELGEMQSSVPAADAVLVDVLAHVVHVFDLIERRLERLEERA